jgi:hypothetical protein
MAAEQIIVAIVVIAIFAHRDATLGGEGLWRWCVRSY